MSADTVRRLFEDAPGVLKISMPRLLKNQRKHQPHVLLRIPQSALEQVHTQQTRLIEVKGRRRSA